MGELQDRFNRAQATIGWANARMGHPLAQMINDKLYERDYKPIVDKMATAEADLDYRANSLLELERRGIKPDYKKEEKDFMQMQEGIAEDYDKLKNVLKYPHSISKDSDIKSYISDFDASNNNFGNLIRSGQARLDIDNIMKERERERKRRDKHSRVINQAPLTEEMALQNAYKTIANKQTVEQNRRNMEEYIRYFHNPEGR